MSNEYELPVLCLCADMVRSVRLRRRFDRDPLRVMREYGFERDDVDAFYTMYSSPGGGAAPSWKGLWDYMWDTEVQNFTVAALKPLPQDPDCQGAPVYPNPRPGLFKVDPLTGTTPSQNVTVKGQGLSPFLVEVYLEDNSAPPVRTLVFSGKPSGTYRCAHLDGDWNLTGLALGNYKIVVVNKSVGGGLDREAEFNQPFVVT